MYELSSLLDQCQEIDLTEALLLDAVTFSITHITAPWQQETLQPALTPKVATYFDQAHIEGKDQAFTDNKVAQYFMILENFVAQNTAGNVYVYMFDDTANCHSNLQTALKLLPEPDQKRITLQSYYYDCREGLNGQSDFRRYNADTDAIGPSPLNAQQEISEICQEIQQASTKGAVAIINDIDGCLTNESAIQAEVLEKFCPINEGAIVEKITVGNELQVSISTALLDGLYSQLKDHSNIQTYLCTHRQKDTIMGKIQSEFLDYLHTDVSTDFARFYSALKAFVSSRTTVTVAQVAQAVEAAIEGPVTVSTVYDFMGDACELGSGLSELNAVEGALLHFAKASDVQALAGTTSVSAAPASRASAALASTAASASTVVLASAAPASTVLESTAVSANRASAMPVAALASTVADQKETNVHIQQTYWAIFKHKMQVLVLAGSTVSVLGIGAALTAVHSGSTMNIIALGMCHVSIGVLNFCIGVLNAVGISIGTLGTVSTVSTALPFGIAAAVLIIGLPVIFAGLATAFNALSKPPRDVWPVDDQTSRRQQAAQLEGAAAMPADGAFLKPTNTVVYMRTPGAEV